jgi:acyl-homoserine lactone acylase PvdQ
MKIKTGNKKNFDIDEVIADFKIYLKDYIDIRKIKKSVNINKRYKQKNDGISSEATEDLARVLIKTGEILSDRYGSNPKVSSTGRNNKKKSNDLYINDNHKIEVKSTTSGDCFTTVSKNNLSCDIWIWFDFNNVVEEKSNYVGVHIIKSPYKNVKPWKINTNNEEKVTLSHIKKTMEDYNDYSFFEFDIINMNIKKENEKYNEFF